MLPNQHLWFLIDHISYTNHNIVSRRYELILVSNLINLQIEILVSNLLINLQIEIFSQVAIIDQSLQNSPISSNFQTKLV